MTKSFFKWLSQNARRSFSPSGWGRVMPLLRSERKRAVPEIVPKDMPEARKFIAACESGRYETAALMELAHKVFSESTTSSFSVPYFYGVFLQAFEGKRKPSEPPYPALASAMLLHDRFNSAYVAAGRCKDDLSGSEGGLKILTALIESNDPALIKRAMEVAAEVGSSYHASKELKGNMLSTATKAAVKLSKIDADDAAQFVAQTVQKASPAFTRALFSAHGLLGLQADGRPMPHFAFGLLAAQEYEKKQSLKKAPTAQFMRRGMQVLFNLMSLNVGSDKPAALEPADASRLKQAFLMTTKLVGSKLLPEKAKRRELSNEEAVENAEIAILRLARIDRAEAVRFAVKVIGASSPDFACRMLARAEAARARLAKQKLDPAAHILLDPKVSAALCEKTLENNPALGVLRPLLMHLMRTQRGVPGTPAFA